MFNSAPVLGVRVGNLALPRVRFDWIQRGGRAYLTLRREDAVALIRALLRARAVTPASLRALLRPSDDRFAATDLDALPARVAREIVARRIHVRLDAPGTLPARGEGEGAGEELELLHQPSPEVPLEGIEIEDVILDADEPHLIAELTVQDDADETSLEAEFEVEDENDPHVEAEVEVVDEHDEARVEGEVGVEDEDEPHVESELVIDESDAA